MSLREKIKHQLFLLMLLTYFVGVTYAMTRWVGIPLIRYIAE